MTSEILRCDCQNTFQDDIHGRGMRVCNHSKKESSQNVNKYRCTVCGKIHQKG